MPGRLLRLLILFLCLAFLTSLIGATAATAPAPRRVGTQKASAALGSAPRTSQGFGGQVALAREVTNELRAENSVAR